MKKYIQDNMSAYQDTAEEFQSKKQIRLNADTKIANMLKSFLKNDDKVLELGTGSGQLSRLLCELSLRVDAIEYASKMAKLAQLTAPDANVIVDEFLDHDFKKVQYSGIIGVAFIHLFDAQDAKTVMLKINQLLLSEGILILSTTVHDKTFNDKVLKSNFTIPVHRFRRHYTPKDFKKLFKTNGFNVLSTTIDDDNEVVGKKWLTIAACKVA